MRPRKIKTDTAILPTIFFLHKHTMSAANPILEKENQPNDSSVLDIKPINAFLFTRAIIFIAVVELMLVQGFKSFLSGVYADALCYTTYTMISCILLSFFPIVITVFAFTIRQISVGKAIYTAFTILVLFTMIVMNYRFLLSFSPSAWQLVCPVLSSLASFCMYMEAITKEKKKDEEKVEV